MRRGDTVYVGLDLGTSGLKGVAIAPTGKITAFERIPYRTIRSAPGQAEQETAEWLSALRDVVRRLAASTPPFRWRAIGLSGMIPTLVLTGDRGKPTGPAVTWQDRRSQAHGDAFRAASDEALGGGDDLYRRTGQRVDGRYLLPMFLRLREAEPRRVETATRLMSAKDYLFWWLTGEYATDPSTATGTGCYDLTSAMWMPEIAALADVQTSCQTGSARIRPGTPCLAPVHPSTTTRPLDAQAASSLDLPVDIPVCVGGADSVLAMLALDATRPGDVAYVTGTSTVIAACHTEPLLEPEQPFLVTPLPNSDDWGLEMDMLSTGSAVKWMADLLGLKGGESEVMDLAEAAPAGDSGEYPSFLPFLGGGEQGALWDPTLRGAIMGLDLSHGRAELARALVEGIVLESRRCLEVLERCGLPPKPVRAAGYGASSPYFRRQLADCTGREVLFPADPERPFSALGAALIAARAVGVDPIGAGSPAAAWVRTCPDTTQRVLWQQRWKRHRIAVERQVDARRCRPSPG